MFDPFLLKSFVTIIDEGGVTQAAKRLDLTQPAISGHLRRLEAKVGKPLLWRTARSFEITPEGAHLENYARVILALNLGAAEKLSRSSFKGRLRLGISEEYLTPHLMEVLRNIILDEPTVKIDIRVGTPGDMVDAIQKEQVDLALGVQCGSHESGRLLWKEPLVLK